MANITQHLTSISLESRSGAPPGRRLLALTLVTMLVLGSTFPGFALARETDSEGEGTAPPVEVPVAPDFDPGGGEEGLEEAPATGGDEEGAVEVEAEVEIEAPASGEVTGAVTEAPAEAAPPPVESPETPVSTSEPEPAEQNASQPSEPVANLSIVAPRQESVESHAASDPAASGEAPPPAEPTEEEVLPPSPQPVAATQADPGRNLAGKSSYVVRPGDCLWHIAAAVLPAGSDTQAIEDKVAELWRMNEDRIGTGDPNLIYPGTELRLR